MTKVEQNKCRLVLAEWILNDLKERLKGMEHYDNAEWFFRYHENLVKNIKDIYLKSLEDEHKEI